MSIVLFNSVSNNSSVTFDTGFSWYQSSEETSLLVGFGPGTSFLTSELVDTVTVSSNFINYEITEAVIGANTFSQWQKIVVVGAAAPQGLRILDENDVELYDSSSLGIITPNGLFEYRPPVWGYNGDNTWFFGGPDQEFDGGENWDVHWSAIYEAMTGRGFSWGDFPPYVDVNVSASLISGKQRTLVVY